MRQHLTATAQGLFAGFVSIVTLTNVQLGGARSLVLVDDYAIVKMMVFFCFSVMHKTERPRYKNPARYRSITCYIGRKAKRIGSASTWNVTQSLLGFLGGFIYSTLVGRGPLLTLPWNVVL